MLIRKVIRLASTWAPNAGPDRLPHVPACSCYWGDRGEEIDGRGEIKRKNVGSLVVVAREIESSGAYCVEMVWLWWCWLFSRFTWIPTFQFESWFLLQITFKSFHSVEYKSRPLTSKLLLMQNFDARVNNINVLFPSALKTVDFGNAFLFPCCVIIPLLPILLLPSPSSFPLKNYHQEAVSITGVLK